jgi:hypothetical protein
LFFGAAFTGVALFFLTTLVSSFSIKAGHEQGGEMNKNKAIANPKFHTDRANDIYRFMCAEMDRDLESLRQCFLKQRVPIADAFVTLSSKRQEWLTTAVEAAQRVDASERMLASSIAIEAHTANKGE